MTPRSVETAHGCWMLRRTEYDSLVSSTKRNDQKSASSPLAAAEMSATLISRMGTPMCGCVRWDATGEPRQGVARHTCDAPIGQQCCAKRLVEPDCRRVPVEDRPFEAAAVTLDGQRS